MPQNEAPGGFLNPKMGFEGGLCPKKGSGGVPNPEMGQGEDHEPEIGMGALQISPKMGRGAAAPAQPNLKSGKPQIFPGGFWVTPQGPWGRSPNPSPWDSRSPKSTHGAGEGPRITPKMGLGEALRNPKPPLKQGRGGQTPP